MIRKVFASIAVIVVIGKLLEYIKVAMQEDAIEMRQDFYAHKHLNEVYRSGNHE